jgi:hypothetical protein
MAHILHRCLSGVQEFSPAGELPCQAHNTRRLPGCPVNSLKDESETQNNDVGVLTALEVPTLFRPPT